MEEQRVRYEASFKFSRAQLGMYVLLASLSVLFASALVALFVTWEQAPVWRSEGSPGLPVGLAGATAALLLQSWTLHGATIALRENRDRGLVRSLALSVFLGLAFLAFQIANWQQIDLALQPGLDDALYVFCFLLLTGLHALHVVGGFPPLLIVLYKAGHHEYTSSYCEPVSLVIQYWHYLTVVWMVLLGALILVTYG